MFEFTVPPEDIHKAEPWNDGEIAYDIYWKSAGLSANYFWIINSSNDEWMGFRSVFTPFNTEKDCYDRENEHEELIWLKKDELLQFIASASLCERLKAVVRTNRFEFAMDRETGNYCQMIREISTGFEIYMYDRADMLVLWTYLSSSFDPDKTEMMQSDAGSGKYRSRYGYRTTEFPLVIQQDGSLGVYIFCAECNEIQDKEYMEYTIVHGRCYDCEQRNNSSSE